MALDADEVVIGSSGHAYVAPLGTAGPTDSTTPLGPLWSELGFLHEDGAEFTPGVDLFEVNGWQSPYPVRRVVTGRTLELAFTMLQWNKVTLPFALGGGAWVGGVYTPPTSAVVDERALVIEWQDGAKHYRCHILRGLVSDLGGFTLARGEAAGLEVTFAMLTESDIAPYLMYSDDPAFV